MSNNKSRSLSTANLNPKGPGRAAATAGRGDGLDAPTLSDHRCVRFARRKARERVKEIEKEHEAAVLDAFRAEMGATVRSASPLLIPLLAEFEMTLDEAVALFQPQAEWPYRPKLFGPKGARRAGGHMYRHSAAGLRRMHITRPPLNCCSFDRPDGGYLLIQVVDHSIEFHAKIGNVILSTRFGELRVEFLDQLPEVVFVGTVGRLVEEVVDHHAWRGRGWRIVEVDDGYPPLSGQTLIANTGSIPYRMPWAR